VTGSGRRKSGGMETNTRAAGVDAIYFTVDDVQKSIDFYRETVGAEPSSLSEEWGAEYDLPDGAGWGFGSASRYGGKASPATVFFTIPDVRSAAERLRQDGRYEVGDVMESPVCTMAFVNDGQGNALCLHQRKAVQQPAT
jgi:predicted enzyme related to lactoylglutathione lyase